MFSLTIPDMTCAHCVRAITEAVQQLDPAAQVQADLMQHRVAVETTVPREAVIKQVGQAGYTAS